MYHNAVRAILVGMMLVGCTVGAAPPDVDAIPVYPGAQVIHVEQQNSLERVTYLETVDDPTTVLAWYKATLPQSGWQFRMQLQTPSGLLFGYTSRNSNELSYTLSVLVRSTDGSRTTIEIHLVKTFPA